MNHIIFTNGTETKNTRKTAGAVVVATHTAASIAQRIASREEMVQEYAAAGYGASAQARAAQFLADARALQVGDQYVVSQHRTVALAAKGRDAARKEGNICHLQVVELQDGFADMRPAAPAAPAAPALTAADAFRMSGAELRAAGCEVAQAELARRAAKRAAKKAARKAA